MPRVLCIRQVAPETPGKIVETITESGLDPVVVRPFEGGPLPSRLVDFKGLVVMGGPMSARELDREPVLQAELRLIESALSDVLPVLGVCLGCQLLARGLGAAILPGDQKEIGRHRAHVFSAVDRAGSIG